MKLKLGMPPEPEITLLGAVRLNEDYAKLHLRALLFGIAVVTPLLTWAWVGRFGWGALRAVGDLEFWQFFLTLAGMMVIHEVIHMLGHPRMGFTRHTILGFLPRHGMFYATYLGVMSRGRFIFVALLPLSLLTVVPYLAAPYLPPTWRAVMTGVSILNGMASSGDLWIIGAVLRRIPRDAVIQGEWFGTVSP
ncbi:DUF3267 domain-containing protein [Luteibacter aegosomaticola]|uniref:DUF3267 domain-containing protein n=1 Tax=Luteibacter aegosomaticola TaxID=2911538 RepID=UPI001FF7AD11|nr:DUF3267 domain-containing protein [Luteibacter aegosomaticola]UPG90213.1 DUF3267 domain-containing protein [Luteibacter aegosomaticola]